MDEVLDLADASDVTLAGGKAASLAKLIRGGFNVPSGFVIIASGRLTDNGIMEAFDKLGCQKVAVRSSAVAEDSAKDSWAGQFETFLNVGRAGLIEAVKKCQASAGSERAKAYAKEKDLQSGKVAVIVQEMVPAEVSGVAFSAHPVTKNNDQIVIEAVKDLAEKLVSGDTTPDTYVLNKSGLSLAEKFLSSNKSILDGEKLSNLAAKIIEVEKLYGFPVDVEWSFAGGELYILQARPITTL